MEGQEYQQDVEINEITDLPEPQDAQEGKSEIPKVFGSLALAAAAVFGAGGMQNAEAGGSQYLEINTPHISVLKEGVNKLGVREFQFVHGMELGIQTEHGPVMLSRDRDDVRPAGERAESALARVTPEQFVNEIRRQNTDLPRLAEQLPSANGTFRINISPYAQEVLNDNHVAYEQGILRKGTYSVHLSGGGQDNPNTECKVTGWKEFNNYVIADCLEIRMESGKPVVAAVKYKINGSDLSVEEIKR